MLSKEAERRLVIQSQFEGLNIKGKTKFINNEMGNKLLPIAIMAHNEEKVVCKAVGSVLTQKTPIGYSVKVVVVANDCNDRTEEIVNSLVEKYPNEVLLISMPEKGKTKAINRAIKYFEQISNTDCLIPYVIFLDADCEFIDNDVLVNFITRLESNPLLCAIGANCLPDVFFNSREDIVSEIYRAIYRLTESLEINSISGMCYCIRLNILKQIDFPEFQFAEDMYVSSRLNGWFLRDPDIKIVFRTTSDLRSEIKKRTKQEISTQRYKDYYSYLKRKGVKVELFEKPLGDDYRWGGFTGAHIIKAWLNLKGFKPKVFVIFYFLIRHYAKLKACCKLKKIRKTEDNDYWKVER